MEYTKNLYRFLNRVIARTPKLRPFIPVKHLDTSDSHPLQNPYAGGVEDTVSPSFLLGNVGPESYISFCFNEHLESI